MGLFPYRLVLSISRIGVDGRLVLVHNRIVSMGLPPPITGEEGKIRVVRKCRAKAAAWGYPITPKLRDAKGSLV